MIRSLALIPRVNAFVNAEGASFSNDGYVNFGNTFDKAHTDAFSFSVWLKRKATGAQMTILCKQDQNSPGAGGFRGYHILIDSTDKLWVFMISNNAVTNQIQLKSTNAVLADTNPHHIAFTYDGSATAAGVKLYVDGSAVAKTVTNDALSATMSTTANLNLGLDPDGVTKNLNAYIDELYLWNKELSAGEVTSIYNSGTPADVTLLAAYAADCASGYRFDRTLTPADAYNGTIYDRKGSNDGTPTSLPNDFLQATVF